MCAPFNSDPVQIPIPLVCLQCEKLVILFSGFLVLEVSDKAGVFLGYLHKNCYAEWKKKNSGSVVEPLAKT